MRAGRKRKSLQPRKPCGRLKQEKPKEAENVWPTPEVMARRKALLGSASETGELECPITLLGKRLDSDQAYAARKARAICERFSMVNRTPRIVVGSMSDYVQGQGAAPAIPPDVEDECKAAFEELKRAVLRIVRHRYAAFPSKSGPASRQAWREVHNLTKGQMPSNMYALGLGLDAIVEHYDLAHERQMEESRPVHKEAA